VFSSASISFFGAAVCARFCTGGELGFCTGAVEWRAWTGGVYSGRRVCVSCLGPAVRAARRVGLIFFVEELDGNGWSGELLLVN
jgi:hypothetical protein